MRSPSVKPRPIPVKRGLTVLGNVAIDRVDDAGPTPGGCPSFIGASLKGIGVSARVVTRLADEDQSLFGSMLDSYPVPITILPAASTNAFQLRYQGENRKVIVDAVGDAWTPADIDAASIDTEWVHIAPLLRDEFPVATLRYLADMGHRISFDGQGLVRESYVGELIEDGRFDAAVLRTLTVLKVAEEEANIVIGAHPTVESVTPLGVPEVLVTLGSAGCDIFAEAKCRHVPVVRPVHGVHANGAGEVFAVGFAAFRSMCVDPVQAAVQASELVAKMLESRR